MDFADVRYWHLADIPELCSANVRFWGVKRPFPFAAANVRL